MTVARNKIAIICLFCGRKNESLQKVNSEFRETKWQDVNIDLQYVSSEFISWVKVTIHFFIFSSHGGNNLT